MDIKLYRVLKSKLVLLQIFWTFQQDKRQKTVKS